MLVGGNVIGGQVCKGGVGAQVCCGMLVVGGEVSKMGGQVGGGQKHVGANEGCSVGDKVVGDEVPVGEVVPPDKEDVGWREGCVVTL